MKNLKLLIFGLFAIAVVISYTPSYGSPGNSAKIEKHHVITKAIVKICLTVEAHQFFIAVLPAKVASVPKTKVYSVAKYYGMTVGTDISHQYARAKIIIPYSDFGFCLSLPPRIKFS